MPIGYRVASMNFETLKVETKQFKHSVDTKIGSEVDFGGLYLGSDKGFLKYYLSDPEPDELLQDIILAYEFSEEDLIQGDMSPDQELIVSKAKLASIEFGSSDMQEKWSHLIDNSSTAKRKEIHEGKVVKLPEGSTLVVRALDSKMSHIMDGDYCYVYRGIMTGESHLKRVLERFEDGDQPTTGGETDLINAISHAVTMAITLGENKKVMLFPVKTGELTETTNGGEYFYKERNKKGRVIYSIDENGITEPVSRKQQSTVLER